VTYKESISWLFNQFPAYQNVGVAAYKPDLDNVLALCKYFKVDYSKLKFIHVAGTNGKGSTSNYLASILQESGTKTGLFTSPHILDFRERIRVNGEMISEQKVLEFCKLIQTTNFDIKPSFFEITWVLALIQFIESDCDICVIETGLGGRLDATNIINPILSVITNIGLDHTAILGNTLAEIAFEKAGIIKRAIPVVLGEKNQETKAVFGSKALEMQTEIYFSEDFKFENTFFPLESYLAQNEKTVRASIAILNKIGFNVSEENILSGLKNVYLNTGFYGRFQQIQEKPKIILDAAHNKHGIEMLLKSISKLKCDKLHIIYGASNDKNLEEIVALFPSEAQLYLTSFSNMRSFSYQELMAFQLDNKKIQKIYPTIHEAFIEVQTSVNENDMLLITGSFFLLSDFFAFFSEKDLLK
jgi:dihydrofolate synthase/folylpolyglutamate synthase